MASLKQIRRRIKTAKNIQQITKAMKMVAAARLRRSQARILAARPYAQKIESLISDLGQGGQAAGHPLMEARPGLASKKGPLNLVVFTADKGFCGGLNANILRRTLALLRENAGRPVSLTLVGRKGCDFFKRFQFPVSAQYQQFMSNLSYADAELIGGRLIEGYAKGEWDEVVLVYTHFKSVVTLKVTEKRLLPLAAEAGAEADAPAKAGTSAKAADASTGLGINGKAVDFTFEPSGPAVLESLAPRAAKSQVWRALLESLASEFAARMTAMDSASRNSKEMINSLTLTANRIRQAAITKEISELVGGAEALK
jgi:F-type H+-transporting ATPase subunit gamma